MTTTRSQTILDEIVAASQAALEATKRARPLAEVEALARRQRAPRDFLGALRVGGKPRLIAEAKKASPSKGLLVPEYDAASLARRYEAAGAVCLSVLTEPRYFQGDLDHLSAARDATGPPCLRKDFLFDPYQVLEARAAGADAVLLIAAILPRSSLVALRELAEYLGMAALVEVHDEREVDRALGGGASLVGINNRDLRTFQVSLETTARLRPLIPADRLVVAESGIHTRDDVRRLRDLGVDAMLVGEALVKSGDVGAKVRELLGRAKMGGPNRHLHSSTGDGTAAGSLFPGHPTTPRGRMGSPGEGGQGVRSVVVKICGLRDVESARAAVEAGADLLGFVFAPSRRRVSVEEARAIARALPAGTKTVGVFVNESPALIAEAVAACGLAYVQLSGDEPPEVAATLTIPAIKAVRPRGPESERELAAYAPRVEMFVLDSYRPGAYGGTGEVGDWTLAASLAGRYPCLLAGGLTPENVSDAIERVGPLGVDVSGGVEVAGAKRPERIYEFVRAARRGILEGQR